MADGKKRKDKSKSTLSSMQEVTYSREFRMADRAGGFISNKRNS
ncbi:YfhE family protein [Bacillus pinisoli]|nr:YfhE family protein [Bacillus pinisoli]